MTASHPMHKKKSIHMHFRRSPRERRLFYRMMDRIEQICSRPGKKVLEQKAAKQ